MKIKLRRNDRQTFGRQYEYAVIPDTVEIRRRAGRYEFRPIVREGTYLGAVAKAELFAQGGAWNPVPEHLMADAIDAFK